jgi:hypothetical protein
VNIRKKLVVLQNLTIVDKLRQYLEVVHKHLVRYTESHPRRQGIWSVNFELTGLCELLKEMRLDEMTDTSVMFDLARFEEFIAERIVLKEYSSERIVNNMRAMFHTVAFNMKRVFAWFQQNEPKRTLGLEHLADSFEMMSRADYEEYKNKRSVFRKEQVREWETNEVAMESPSKTPMTKLETLQSGAGSLWSFKNNGSFKVQTSKNPKKYYDTKNIHTYWDLVIRGYANLKGKLNALYLARGYALEHGK